MRDMLASHDELGDGDLAMLSETGPLPDALVPLLQEVYSAEAGSFTRSLALSAASNVRPAAAAAPLLVRALRDPAAEVRSAAAEALARLGPEGQKALPALLLTMTKQGFFLIPLILLLPLAFGLDGIWYAFPVADVLSAAVTYWYLQKEVKSKLVPC